MKKRIIAFVLMLAITVTCFTATVFAASYYTSTLGFQGEHWGSARDYTGQNISWSGYTYTQYQTSVMGTTFKVSLYRKKIIGRDFIGTVTLPRTGNHNKTWTNVGSGSYQFYYEKPRDGANVKSDLITMRSN